MQTFGHRLAWLLKERGVNQTTAAQRAGISGASFSDWVNDHVQPANIKAEPLLRAAQFLRADPYWLLMGAGTAPAAHAPAVRAAEPAPRYAEQGWPFEQIDRRRLGDLPRDDLMRLEGAWLLMARQLGLDVGRR
jgi:transcriptional regulator with XRE-family HTH domain